MRCIPGAAEGTESMSDREERLRARVSRYTAPLPEVPKEHVETVAEMRRSFPDHHPGEVQRFAKARNFDLKKVWPLPSRV